MVVRERKWEKMEEKHDGINLKLIRNCVTEWHRWRQCFLKWCSLNFLTFLLEIIFGLNFYCEQSQHLSKNIFSSHLLNVDGVMCPTRLQMLRRANCSLAHCGRTWFRFHSKILFKTLWVEPKKFWKHYSRKIIKQSQLELNSISVIHIFVGGAK